MFWLGLGVGFIITSLLLGLTMGESTPAEEVSHTEPFPSDNQLREAAEERGYHLVSNAAWDKLNDQKEKNKAKPTERQQASEASVGTIYMYVPEGFSWQQTADVLAKANIVKKSEDIMQAMKEMGRQQHLQSGLYTFQATESSGDIVTKLSQASQ